MARAKSNSKKDGSKITDKNEVRNDALKLINRIITDEKFAADFFFGEMRPKTEALAVSYNRAFNLDIKSEDVATVAYIFCWENDWKKLRDFKGETSAHTWIAKMASQATYKFLVEEKFIPGVSTTRTNDYRLTVRSIVFDDVRQAIVDMVFNPEKHEMLQQYYVEKKDLDVVIQNYEDKEEAKAVFKDAEKTLIEQLLNTENPFAEMALSLKHAIDPETPFLPWHDRIDGDDCYNRMALRSILAQIYNNDDWDENALVFVNRMVAQMNWDARREYVWREKFFKGTPSRQLAAELNVRNTWIDNEYYRLNRQLHIALKTWWNNI